MSRRIIIVQPSLRAYRMDFFNRLAHHFGGEFKVYASLTDHDALTRSSEDAPWAYMLPPIRSLRFGADWQPGALSIALARGDIIVVCGGPRTLSTLMVLLKARMKGATTIWWGHFWSSTSVQWRHRLRLRLMRLADAVLFYTDAEVEEFRAQGWSHHGPIHALNNGLDLVPIRAQRSIYCTNQRSRAVLFIGRLREECGLDLLFQSLTRIEDRTISVHVIGSGVLEPALKAQARELGVSEQIVWHGGTADEGIISSIANRCVLFVYPGSVGLSLIHGMAYGLPCIVHNDRSKHGPEIAAFENNGTGRSFIRNNPSDLARVLSKLINDDESLNRFSRRCVEVTDQTFNTDDMAKRFSALITKIRKY